MVFGKVYHLEGDAYTSFGPIVYNPDFPYKDWPTHSIGGNVSRLNVNVRDFALDLKQNDKLNLYYLSVYMGKPIKYSTSKKAMIAHLEKALKECNK